MLHCFLQRGIGVDKTVPLTYNLYDSYSCAVIAGDESDGFYHASDSILTPESIGICICLIAAQDSITILIAIAKSGVFRCAKQDVIRWIICNFFIDSVPRNSGCIFDNTGLSWLIQEFSFATYFRHKWGPASAAGILIFALIGCGIPALSYRASGS